MATTKILVRLDNGTVLTLPAYTEQTGGVYMVKTYPDKTRIAFSRSYDRIGTIVGAIPASAITDRWPDYQGGDGVHGDAVWFGSR